MKKFYLLSVAIILAVSGVTAQISKFCFTATSGTYTQNTGGTDVDLIEQDDNNVQNIPIGFTFNYIGNNYTQGSVSSNGWFSFTNGNPSDANSAGNNIATTTAGLVNTLYPLWDDLDGANGIGSGTASYRTTGSVGSRIFTMEWRDWRWNYNATNAVISFQVKLYEGTNIIEYIYRREAGNIITTGTGYSQGASIGLTDITGGSTHYLSLNNSGANPTVSSTVPTNNITAKPATNQIYRFTPSATPTITGLNPNPVCNAGTTVTITGTNFNACLTGVSFNGTAASTFAFVNATTITATVPVAATTGPVSITTAGGTATSATSLTIGNNGTLSLTSGSASNTICINNAITNIVYTIGGSATGAVLTGSLPTGVTGSFAAGLFTISGTATSSGTFNYSVTTTGSSCTNPSLNGSITVNSDATIALSSASGTDAQSICINNPISNITYAIGGGTGATITGLPAGITGNFAAGTLTISGTASAAGVFNYSITTTGPCANQTIGGIITVTDNGTITLTSAAGTINQSVCLNNSIADIIFTIAGTANAASIVSGSLPTGITGIYNAGIFTISGTATVAGIYNFTIGTSGSTCINQTIAATITVNENPVINLSSAVGTDAQVLCALTPIADIVYSITGFGTTGANASGLPAGVSGNYNAGIFTISGTPTIAGLYNYTVLTTGPCANTSLNGSIDVNSNGTISLSSVVGSDNQVRCLNNAITDITYTIAGSATGALITAGSLPVGVTGNFNAGIFTISGTPTSTGVYNYTVGTTGSGCANLAISGTITVNENATIVLSSLAGTDAQTICINNPLSDIIYSTGGFGTTGATLTGLPAGIVGNYAAGIITISGTATVSGVFNYLVTTTGTCINASASGTITINANSTLALSGGVATQTVCINTAIANITYTIAGGGTGAIISAGSLPAGVTGTFNAGLFTITGTPTVSGTFPFSITTTGPCLNPTLNGNIIVQDNASISLSSAVGTNAQTLCINTALSNISYTIAGSGTGATVTGLPAGITGSFSAGTFSIIGTPTVAGTFNYTVTTTGPCIKPTASGTIIVQPNSTITLTSGTTSQTRCINTALTTVTFTIGGSATNASITSGSLPPGVTGSIASSIFTISGTPTTSGIFPYTITATGPCANATVSGTITVNADATITLTSAAGSNTQTTCINTSITTITYAIGGGGTGATITGLPSGLTGNYAAGVYSISGSPTVAGTFNYLVTTTGPCVKPTAGGTIIVQPNATITRTSAAATTTQTICVNNSISNITYSIGGSGTGATVSGLPAGISGTFAAGVYTISGIATNTGTYNYTITTTGPCLTPGASGTITVNADATLTLTSAAATVTQTRCISTAITNITYLIAGGGTGATVTGLPAGVTGNYNAGTKIFTISGSPSVAGIFNYTVTTTGPCVKPALSGTITVTPNGTISLSSGAGSNIQTLCTNSAITNITYTIGGSGTGATVSGLPAGVTGNFSAGTYTISGAPTASGTFNYVITTTGPCVNPSLSGILTVSALPSGSLTATENSVIVNDNIICAGANVTFTATSGFGSYIFKVNGINVQSGISNVYNSTVLTNGASVTVDVANGANCGVTFGPVVISVNPLPVATLISDKTSICPGENVQFTAGGGTSYTFRINGAPVQSGVSNIFNSTSLSNGNSISVTVTNSNGCSLTTAPIVITVNNVPTGTLQSTATTICSGTNVTFTATAGYSNYEFKVNGSTLQNGSSNIFNSNTLINPSVVAVIVSNVAGCSSTFGPIVITVNALPAGVLTATENSGTVNDNNICSGSTVTFTATSGFTNYDFLVNGISQQNSNSNIFNTATLADNDVISVVVSNGNNCFATLNTILFTVISSPAGSLSASETSICAGENIIFTATAGFSNYNFMVNGGTIQNGTGNSYSSTSISNGDLVTVEVTNVNGCTTIFTGLTIAVTALPSGSLLISENSASTANDGFICSGATVIFTAPAGFTNYNFLLNNISIQNGIGNSYTSSTLNNGDQVTVAVTNSGGCIGLLNGWLISVSNFPAVAPITGLTSICRFETTLLSNATPGGVWSSSDLTNATIDASGLVTGVSAGTAVIGYTLTNAAGCSTVASSLITIHGLPFVGAITGNSNICVNNTTQLNSITTGGTWSSDNSSIAFVNATGLVTGLADGIAVISYTVTNVFNCTRTVSIAITVNAPPVLNPITGNIDICVGTTSQLLNDTDGGIWSSSNNTIATVNASTGLVTAIAPGTITISYTVTDGNGCSDTEVVTVNSWALPIPTLTGPNPICPNSTGTYITEAGQSNYTWIFTGGTLVSGGSSTDNSITILWDQPGPKTILINYTNANGCSAVTSATVTTSTGTIPTISGTTETCLNEVGNYLTDPGQSNYIWTVTGGTISAGGTSTDNTASITWTTAGTGSVSINYTDPGGCIAASSVSLPVLVHTLPTATISGSTSVCQNATSPVLNFSGSNGLAPYTFTYTINNGTAQTITTVSGNSISLNIPTGSTGLFVYELISVSDNNNCTQLLNSTATINVNELPVGSITGTTIVCENNSSPLIIFTATSGTAPFVFSYNINGGTTQTINTVSGNTATLNVPTGATGNFIYSLVGITDVNNCSQPQSGDATVTVVPSPTATISGTTAVCQNGVAPNITFTGSNGTAPYTFTYTINGGSNVTVSSVGNTAIVTVPVNISGTFIYSLVSVQDAGANLCSQVQTGSVTVTVNATSVGGTVSGSASVCSGSNSGLLTLSAQTGNVTGWEYSVDGGTSWIAVANTSTTFAYNNLTVTTIYHAIVQSGVCNIATSSNATITVSQPSVGGAVTASATVCSGTNSGTLTLGTHTGTVIRWELSIDGGASWTPIANTTTTQNYNNLIQTTLYRAVVSNGVCPSANAAAATITVIPLPTASITGTATVCLNAASPTITFTGANGTAPYTFTYKINGGANLTVVSVGNTATLNAPTGIAGVFNYSLFSVQSAGSTVCSQSQTGTATITVNAPPAIFTITPASANICQGNVQPLTASGGGSSTGTQTFSSGNVNLAIPEGNRASTIAVAGIPAGAVINSVSVNFNIAHGYDADLVLNLRAPNGNTLNLVNERGGSGDNFTNTTISSASVNPVNAGTAPFSSTYAADAANNVGTPNSNVNNFNSLYSTPNGNWIFNADDVVNCHGGFFACFVFGTGTYFTGTLNSWSITFNYTLPTSPVAATWLPITGLYTDAGATASYTGQNLSTVYAKPLVTTTYTATTTNAANCSRSQTVTVAVSQTPVVSISADYCVVPNKVRLTATSVPAASSYAWSNGATTSFIDVDVAGSFDVTVFAGGSCPGTASINVAQELVVNGDFEAGNTGFVTPPLGPNQYVYQPDIAGNTELYPEGLYGVGPNANTFHNNFWGQDHTTGTGNFMIINGFPNGNPQPIVWQATVTVLPNTAYYFAAWGMSVNNSGPFAQLQFNVNGAQVGTVATLPAGVNNNSNNGWTRFYGTWTSGPTTTTAIISITDLQNAAGGNDFGLDDISFATLSTFITLQSASGTDAQTLCTNTAINNIVYSIGNGNPSGPTVTGLPAGVTSSFSGNLLTISGTPTIAGIYSYTITTTGGCLVTNATGTINAQAQGITLSSGSSTTTVCTNNAVSIGYTLSGTATGATVTGLPAGVTGSIAGSIYTLSGTPTIAGTYLYNITTTGTCTPVTTSGTIIVQQQTILLNSGNNLQTVCINSPIVNIQYTIGGTGSGVTLSGLPAGVSFSYNSGIVFITGAPTVAGNFNYTISTTGTCLPVTAAGTINVTANASIVLSSTVGTNSQVVCRNTAITNIVYSINGATGATVTGLPTGVSGLYNAGTFTISGTPTVNGVFNYTINTNGGCGTASINGTVTVQIQTITLSSGSASPTICINSPVSNIVYTIAGSATGATASGLPTGVGIAVSGNQVTISGTATVNGIFPYTITTTGSCTAATATGTITVQSGANGGTIASVTVCSGGSGTLTVTGQTGSIVRWEYSTDNGATWISITNTTITQVYSNIIDPTLYRAVVNNGCGLTNSSTAGVAVRNYWTGATSNNWNTASNWSDNLVPSTLCADVHIKGGKPFQPTLGSGTATIENLNIYPGAILTVEDAKLGITGFINNNGTLIASDEDAIIELAGSNSQSIAANTFQNNALGNLIINNSSVQGVTIAGALDIYRSVTFTGTGRKLNTGGFLTFKSTIEETAWIGDLTGNTISGDATVERYIATGIGSAPNHGKSWQLLAVPTTGQTIKQAWQEGAVTNNGNPNPGFGTMLTSNVPNAATQPNPGFDVFTAPGPSIKTYNSVTNTFDGPTSTNNQLYNPKGHFILVRGDRSVIAFNQPATPTVLRSKGLLFTPANPPAVTNVVAGRFESVGNPYASALDIRNITRTGGVDEFFYVWDPRLGGGNNLGAYQTLFKVGANYFAIPGGGSYGSGVNNFIQSGQAFLVQATGTNGNISFSENAKVAGSRLLMRENQVANLPSVVQTSLYAVSNDGSNALVDGALAILDNNYANAVDGFDAKKPGNTGENVSIRNNSTLLSVDRRQAIAQQDTIFLNLTGTRAQAYQFEFKATGLGNDVEGFIQDKYLQTLTALNDNGTTVVNFSIANIPGSYAPDRFRIIFNRLRIVPVTFTSVKAYRKDAKIKVEWNVENEINVKQYEVEKSLSGNQFNIIAVKKATANNGATAGYNISDENPVNGYNYYRIRSVDHDGKVQYSPVVKVLVEKEKEAGIAIYPNPITNGVINLQLTNQPAGEYGIKLYNKLGQVILSKKVQRSEGNSTEKINWDFNLAHGMYHLEVLFPDGSKKIIKVLY